MFKGIITTMALAFFILTAPAQAAQEVYTPWLHNKAVSGYDTVSYHTEGKPVVGKDEFKTTYKGATWLFSSQENLDLFKANPEKYEPQYGGYCAWAVAHDNLVKADPKVWTIIDGKLYLNYDKSIEEKWLPRQEELIPVGDKKYPELIKN